MAHAKNHDYHILNPSIWPLLSSLFAFVMLTGGILWMHSVTPFVFLIGFVGTLYCMFAWWSEVVEESKIGDHTPVVQIGLRYGFILFIMSEVMFFAAWFWSFFKHAIYPMNEYVGSTYISAGDLSGCCCRAVRSHGRTTRWCMATTVQISKTV